MELVFENASAMDADAARLIEQKGWRGAEVLRAIADEEASKYLILLDAVRCPRGNNEEKKVFARHLSSFNQHLAKGIYAEYCYISPVSFGEAKGYVESCRPTLYLDGPDYILWIFRNRILQKREARVYVDYVNTDEGKHWTTPADELEPLSDCGGPLYSAALRLVGALQKLGISDPQALSVVADTWRPVPIVDGLRISELERITTMTLKKLDDKKFLNQDRDAISIVTDRWLYPLYP